MTYRVVILAEHLILDTPAQITPIILEPKNAKKISWTAIHLLKSDFNLIAL